MLVENNRIVRKKVSPLILILIESSSRPSQKIRWIVSGYATNGGLMKISICDEKSR